MAEPIQHAGDCDPGDACVECGGCDCGAVGAVPRSCADPGCYSVDDHDQWHDDNGDWEACSYG